MRRFTARAMLLFMGLALVPCQQASAQDADECASSTPGETWSRASTAFEAEDLALVATCLAPQSRQKLVFRLLPMADQLVQMMRLTTAEEGSPEYEADERAARKAADRLIEIQRRQGLPVTAEEAAAIDPADRHAILSSIDYATMISDLILFIESLRAEEEELPERSSYFTSGELGTELTDVAIDGNDATGRATGPVNLTRIDAAWYLTLER